MAQSKIELLLKLSDKIFNNKLAQVQQKLSGGVEKMQAKLQQLKAFSEKTFGTQGTKLAQYFTAAFKSIPFANILTHPLTLLTVGAYKLHTYLKNSVLEYKATAQEESKLSQIMKNTMSATKLQFNEIRRHIVSFFA